MKKAGLLYLFITYHIILFGQHSDANIFGDVQSKGEHIPFASIIIEGTQKGTATDVTGHYMLIDLEPVELVLIAKAVGYREQRKVVLVEGGKTLEVNFELEELTMSVNEVVITGTKIFKRQTDSPIIVNVLESKALDQVQACNISEGLRFQPGLRVETDCQTCNYTQLRMNGLGGGYSQILINGRPIFSPLTGLYGMEQIPSNMVERIEVVRGGGSALYGSSAVGGTVNIITKIPDSQSFDFSATGFNIGGSAYDKILSGNLSMINTRRNVGASIYVNNRHRDAYDHPGIQYGADAIATGLQKDGFSELPELRNNSFGANLFFQPTFNQKLELSFSSLHEYRYGGEIIDEPAHFAQQSEERVHHVFMGGLDYQVNFNEDNSSFIFYLAGQNTDRDHYTGIMPEEADQITAFLANPPYGITSNVTLQGGTQLNHRLNNFLGGTNVLTFGAEYVYDNVFDSIAAYNYITDQETTTLGSFLQSDWEVTPDLNLLTGLRGDKHNLVDNVIFSPRLSLLYKHLENTQLRATWGTGFRAPQAFDADMHIAFAGGGVSRIELDPDLEEERSNSFSASINYDKPSERFIAGFTLEGFYTKLKHAFYQHPIGKDQFGEVFQKRNGPGATVQGGTLELRANYNRKAQLEAGYTLQSSMHDEAVENIEGLEAKREFLRSPNQYGYWSLTATPNERFNATLSGVFTGKMLLTHYTPVAYLSDEYRESPAFVEWNLKVSYTFNLTSMNTGLELFGGVKNLTNAYQNDFDNGKNRDSNYVYGPSAPSSIYLGIRVKSF